jgi:FAD synthase
VVAVSLKKDLYGSRLLVHCEAYLRPERRFESVDDLITQLARDREAAIAALEAGGD